MNQIKARQLRRQTNFSEALKSKKPYEYRETEHTPIKYTVINPLGEIETVIGKRITLVNITKYAYNQAKKKLKD